MKTSIIILCYNGLDEATRPCIDSVLVNTDLNRCELIIVDNASTDGTKEYLSDLSKKWPNIKIQINSENKGYAGGNNDGIRMAKGDYIVLLNNDTLVPQNWLDRLIKLFDSQSKVGLIGPITNSAGNEQRISIPRLTEKNYERKSEEYVVNQKGVWFTTEKLGFFCIAIRQDVINKIGYLDENYGVGMFEDDDYCVSAKKAGFELAIVEDCFVYHKGSVSFKKLNTDEYTNIFSQNRDYFYKKHSIVWVYSDIVNLVWNRIKLDIQSLDPNSKTRAIVRLSVMEEAILQVKNIETRLAKIEGISFAEIKLAQQHQELMKLSDWATSLKKDLEATSDWAVSMKKELDDMAASRFYKFFRLLQRKGF